MSSTPASEYRYPTHPFEYFVNCVLSMSPSTALDVGCGRGRLLAALKRHDVSCMGVDPGAHNLQEAAKHGVQVIVGTAEALPFPDGAIDVVCIRHVLHHLKDARLGVHEAWRVARKGVVLAEPWYDLRRSDQRIAWRLDRWSKNVHQALGYSHFYPLEREFMVAELRRAGAQSCCGQETVSTEAMDVKGFEREMDQFCVRLPPGHPLLSSRDRVFTSASRARPREKGSVIVWARK